MKVKNRASNGKTLDHSQQTYLVSVRRHLHRYPELSGDESQTASYVRSELEKASPDRLIEGVGGHGLLAIYDSGRPGPDILLRSELDALPIQENSGVEYHSTRKGISHACGHDGHMSVMIGMARFLNDRRPPAGRVVLLFQPSEENGEGAEQMLSDSVFANLNIDRSYAFHNLPGFEKGTILLRDDTFAAASIGLEFRFKGWTSHAAYPEQGASPARTMAGLIERAQKETKSDLNDPDYGVATVTWARLGSAAYGITPGEGSMGITLRAATDRKLDQLTETFKEYAGQLAESDHLQLEVAEREPFVATVNDPKCTHVVRRAVSNLKKKVHELNHPFPWSEDFGHFSRISKVALIGIGAGLDHPHLHAPEYDFPDDLLPAVTTLFTAILEEEWRSETN